MDGGEPPWFVRLGEFPREARATAISIVRSRSAQPPSRYQEAKAVDVFGILTRSFEASELG